MDKFTIIFGIGCVILGCMIGMLSVVVAANIAHAKDMKKARKAKELQAKERQAKQAPAFDFENPA